MSRLALTLASVVIAVGTAHAEQAPSAASAESAIARPIAVAINNPLGWRWSLGASAWVGWDEHHAIRANFARYRGPLSTMIVAALEADHAFEDEDALEPDFGHTTDLSLGWAYYPRRVLDGAMVEIGVLCRFHRLRDRIDDHNMAKEERHTNIYGGRVLVGWTLRLSDWWFIAPAIGGALGYERGREKTFVGYDTSGGMSREIINNARVSRPDVSVEAYLRVGLAFGQ